MKGLGDILKENIERRRWMHKRPDFKCLRMDLLAADILLARTESLDWCSKMN